jgi:hypothetical protein
MVKTDLILSKDSVKENPHLVTKVNYHYTRRGR